MSVKKKYYVVIVAVFSLMSTDALAGATTMTVSVCPRCGTIAKSGKPSCCGRGGSWFKSCGGGSNTQHPRTWYDGIQACKSRPRFKRGIGQQLNAAEQKGTGFSQDTSISSSKRMSADTPSIVTPTTTSDNEIVITSLMTSTFTNCSTTFSTHSSAISPMAARQIVNQLKIIVHHIIILFITVFQ